MPARPVALLLIVLVLPLVAGCSEPPNKEIGQAQGAIEAARAAGADRYASTEFQAAVTALAQAQDAVTQRDYRLALNYALDGRERAQEAARQAADQKAVVRSEVDRTLASVDVLLRQGKERLKAAETARIPAREVANGSTALDAAEQSVQKARAAHGGDDYLKAREILTGVETRVREATAEIDAVAASRSPRRRR